MVSIFIDVLTLKAPSKICSIRHLFFLFNFSKKTSLDISCESSVRQTIHMKYQDLFSFIFIFFFYFFQRKQVMIFHVNFKMSSAAVVIGALRVNVMKYILIHFIYQFSFDSV